MNGQADIWRQRNLFPGSVPVRLPATKRIQRDNPKLAGQLGLDALGGRSSAGAGGPAHLNFDPTTGNSLPDVPIWNSSRTSNYTCPLIMAGNWVLVDSGVGSNVSINSLNNSISWNLIANAANGLLRYNFILPGGFVIGDQILVTASFDIVAGNVTDTTRVQITCPGGIWDPAGTNLYVSPPTIGHTELTCLLTKVANSGPGAIIGVFSDSIYHSVVSSCNVRFSCYP